MRIPEHLKTAALLVVCVVIYGCFASACAADTVTAASDCTNELRPPTFRLVLSTGDTLPRITNRYLEPHRNSETFRIPLDGGSTLVLPVTYQDPRYCITALDSAAWSTNHTLRVIE